MKASQTNRPDRVSLSVQMSPDLKRRVAEAARRDRTTKTAWVVKAIEARLAADATAAEKRAEIESQEFLHEEKLNDIRALRETW